MKTGISRRTFFQMGIPAAMAAGLSFGGRGRTARASGRPDVYFVMTDDQDAASLEARILEDGQWVPAMRHLLSGRGGGWTRYERAYCAQAICAPSRATALSGLYSHHHGVERNGWIDRMARPDETVARWLHDAGYFTIFRGKYSFGKRDRDIRKPEGWDVWEPGGGLSAAVFPRVCDLVRGTAADRPIFACLWPVDPHIDAQPSAAHRGQPVEIPGDLPSVNEEDMSDKPRRMRGLRPLRKGKLDALRKERGQAARALADVDDGIRLLLDTLEETGRLANAVIIFAGDHGFHWGEHRLERKDTPYREAVGFPLLIRDPGQAGSRTDGRIVSNVDLAATIAGFAGVEPMYETDGEDLRAGPGRGWAFFEKPTETRRDPGTFRGVYAVESGEEWCFVMHGTGEEELYNLAADPWQMESMNGNAPAGVRAALMGLVESAE